MIVYEAHILELDTPIGKRYRVLLECCRLTESAMKNGKTVDSYCMYSGGEINPFGFGTLEEIRIFYDKKRYLTEGIQEPRNFYFLKNHYNSKQACSELLTLSFAEICDMVTCKLDKTTTLVKLFHKKPKVSIKFEINGYSCDFSKISIEQVFEEWLKIRSLQYKIISVVFHGYHETKKQREEMERNYFLLRIQNEVEPCTEYVMPLRGGIYQTTIRKYNAIQFISEDKALDFVQKYQDLVGKTGFTIEEVPGMKLEDGLEIW